MAYQQVLGGRGLFCFTMKHLFISLGWKPNKNWTYDLYHFLLCIPKWLSCSIPTWFLSLFLNDYFYSHKISFLYSYMTYLYSYMIYLLFLHDYLSLLLYDYLSIPMWLYFSIPLWLVSCYIFSIPTWLFLNLLHDNLSLIVHDMTIFLYTCIIFSIPSSYSCLFYMTIYSYMTFLYSFMFIPTWLIFDIFLITILPHEICSLLFHYCLFLFFNGLFLHFLYFCMIIFLYSKITIYLSDHLTLSSYFYIRIKAQCFKLHLEINYYC